MEKGKQRTAAIYVLLQCLDSAVRSYRAQDNIQKNVAREAN